MKKSTIILAILVFTGNAFSQIPKGSVWGLINFSMSSEKAEYSTTVAGNSMVSGDNEYKSSNIGPGVLYFIKDNLAVGLSVGRSGNKSTNTSVSQSTKYESKSSGIGMALSLNKFYNVSDQFKPFLAFNMGTNPSKSTNTTTNTTTNNSSKTENEYKFSYVNFGGGFAFLPTPRIMFAASLAVMGFEKYNNKYNIVNDNYNTNKGSYFSLYTNSNNFLYNLSFSYRFTK